MLGAAEGPLVVQGPHQRHGQAADLLDREGAITQPVQVQQIGLALVVALLQNGAHPTGWNDKEVLYEVAGRKLPKNHMRYPINIR